MKKLYIALALLVLLGCSGNDSGTAAGPPSVSGIEVQVHGALRAMFLEGRVGPMVDLETMLPDPNLYAVGALADLGGEITIVGGEVVLSYPDGPEGARTETVTRSDAAAALLVASVVPAWQSLTVGAPIPFDELDVSVERLALSAGMNLDDRIPFLLEGEFENLQWHVVDGSRLEGGGGSHRDHLAASSRMSADRAEAALIGFYSADDQGVFTHMGSRTHIHCVLKDPPVSGHVDAVTIPAGTVIRFPRLPDAG